VRYGDRLLLERAVACPAEAGKPEACSYFSLRENEHELLNNSLDQVGLADRLGYDFAWEVEHHFLEEDSWDKRAS
jgi:alkanesulfonate monooxygenase SsuD/methylene tetrahydromethanopterin reductase-like flavin-dependent oxidoreductase (luciferase family)